ncbi:MAG: hypothetical protein ABSA93_11265 [Streptosporangiaceae bacterium]
MGESIEELEKHIGELRARVREARLRGDHEDAVALREGLDAAERAWDGALDSLVAPAATRGGASLLPLREQVHEALSLLAVPSAPRLIATVHEAFFATSFPSAKLTSLKRDEERSFRAAPYSRPYYLCAALTVDLLGPSRGLLAVSTWPMQRRVIGSLSPRADFLTAAIHVAEAVERLPEPVPAARRLLCRFATNIPGSGNEALPQQVKQAAEAELNVHIEEDTQVRADAAKRAAERLDDVERLFGSRLEVGRLS